MSRLEEYHRLMSKRDAQLGDVLDELELTEAHCRSAFICGKVPKPGAIDVHSQELSRD